MYEYLIKGLKRTIITLMKFEEQAKNGNGSCMLIEQALNRNGTGTAVPLHGRDIGTFY